MFSRKSLPEVFTLNDCLYSFMFDVFIHELKTQIMKKANCRQLERLSFFIFFFFSVFKIKR